jgi:GPH family glycoside/pentoside/hexuronide:cation symporter
MRRDGDQLSSVGRYGVSTLGKTLPWAAADSFSLFFLTDLIRLPSPVAGVLVFLFFVCGAVSDLGAAWLVGVSKRLQITQRAYFRLATGIMAVCFAGTFWPLRPEGAGLPLILALGLGFRVAYSALDVPHNALLGQLAARGIDPVRLGVSRLVASLTGGIIVALLAKPMLTAPHETMAGASAAFGILVAALGAGLFLLYPRTEFGDLEHGDLYLPSLPFSSLFIILTYYLSTFSYGIVGGLFSKDLIYICKYFFHDTSSIIYFLSALIAGKIISVIVGYATSKRVDLPVATRLSYVLQFCSLFALIFIPRSESIFVLVLIILGFGAGMLNLLSWTWFAKLINLIGHNELYYGAYTAIGKLSGGLSGLFVGFILNARENETADFGVRIDFYDYFTVVPLLFIIISFVFFEASLMILKRDVRYIARV